MEDFYFSFLTSIVRAFFLILILLTVGQYSVQHFTDFAMKMRKHWNDLKKDPEVYFKEKKEKELKS